MTGAEQGKVYFLVLSIFFNQKPALKAPNAGIPNAEEGFGTFALVTVIRSRQSTKFARMVLYATMSRFQQSLMA